MTLIIPLASKSIDATPINTTMEKMTMDFFLYFLTKYKINVWPVQNHESKTSNTGRGVFRNGGGRTLRTYQGRNDTDACHQQAIVVQYATSKHILDDSGYSRKELREGEQYRM
jgi:hypothetical protein